MLTYISSVQASVAESTVRTTCLEEYSESFVKDMTMVKAKIEQLENNLRTANLSLLIS